MNHQAHQEIRYPERRWCLPAVTSICGGLQVIWSVVLANGTVYLLSLGLPEYLTALVWMAGPLCGIFVQPYMGVLSDNHAGKYGRRRPFMIAGTIGIMLSMLLLAFVEQVVDILLGIDDKSARFSATTIAALILVWALNFSIQPLQVGMRAIIIDMFPGQLQSQAGSWASYWVGCGNILGAIAGFISLPHTTKLPGLTQFQCLCLIATLTLGVTAFIACAASKEDVRDDRITTTETLTGIREPLKRILGAYSKLNRTTRQVLVIQFYSWMAWFPFLYYESSYVSNLFTRQGVATSRESTGDTIHHMAARVGNLGFLLFSVAMLITSIFTYIFLASDSTQLKGDNTNLQSMTVTSNVVKVWTTSHVLHAMALALSFFVSSWRTSLVINICMGISFSITQFAPFTILGAECASLMAVDELKVETGTVMALHNAAISSPQLVSASICALFFKAFRIGGFDGSEAWVIGLGAIPATAAAWQAKKLWQDFEEHHLIEVVV